jgi:transcription elongation factor Elf1
LSLERRRYLRRERVHTDPHQAILVDSGIAKNPSLYTTSETSTLFSPRKKVTCPFCLGLEEFRQFLVSTKKGISTGSAKCPLCGLGFRMKSLVGMAKWTPKEYADWVYAYTADGFWKKVKFDTWKKRLFLMGWTNDFWLRYKELKGEDQKNESYTDYLDRAQREQAMEKGWIDKQEVAASNT